MQVLQQTPAHLADVQRSPSSWVEAQAAVQAREEEKRRREQAKASKAKAPALQAQEQPQQAGTVIGSVAEASTFWMFVVSICEVNLSIEPAISPGGTPADSPAGNGRR
jgi:hypothetical protein